LQTGGNVFYSSAEPYAKESNAMIRPAIDPRLRLQHEGDRFILQLSFGPEIKQASTKQVTTALLGKTQIAGLPYENADGSPLTVDTDYFGKKRHKTNPTPGPFERPGTGQLALKVW
jgi:alpha-N-arabinofuranosidase